MGGNRDGASLASQTHFRVVRLAGLKTVQCPRSPLTASGDNWNKKLLCVSARPLHFSLELRPLAIERNASRRVVLFVVSGADMLSRSATGLRWYATGGGTKVSSHTNDRV